MLTTHDQLIALGLTGMAKALEDQRRQPDIVALAFEERIAMMIDREAIASRSRSDGARPSAGSRAPCCEASESSASSSLSQWPDTISSACRSSKTCTNRVTAGTT